MSFDTKFIKGKKVCAGHWSIWLKYILYAYYAVWHVFMWGAWSIARHTRPSHGMAGSPRMCFHIRSSPQVIHSLAFALCPVAISPGNLVWRESHPGHRTTSRLTQDLCITRSPCTFVQPTLPIYSTKALCLREHLL